MIFSIRRNNNEHFFTIMVCLLFLMQTTTRVYSETMLERSAHLSSEVLRNKAKETYRKALTCMILTPVWNDSDKAVSYEFPYDAETHYAQILAATENFRGNLMHTHPDGFQGPWIDNLFISKYLHKPLHFFNGFVPLFIEWNDYPNGGQIVKVLNKLLRPNVLYLTICPGDIGLLRLMGANEHKNIFVMSPGGHGHVILPLIKEEITASPPPPKYEQDIGFFGHPDPGFRHLMFPILQAAALKANMTMKIGRGSGAVLDMYLFWT